MFRLWVSTVRVRFQGALSDQGLDLTSTTLYLQIFPLSVVDDAYVFADQVKVSKWLTESAEYEVSSYLEMP